MFQDRKFNPYSQSHIYTKEQLQSLVESTYAAMDTTEFTIYKIKSGIEQLKEIERREA